MAYIIDTNILSAVIHARPAIVERLAACQKDQILVPQPVIAEIEFGLSLMARGKRRGELSKRWALVREALGRVQWTDEVSVSFGVIKAQLRKQGRIIEDFDIAIAAHAHALKCTLVTHNTRHFSRIAGLKLEAWA